MTTKAAHPSPWLFASHVIQSPRLFLHGLLYTVAALCLTVAILAAYASFRNFADIPNDQNQYFTELFSLSLPLGFSYAFALLAFAAGLANNPPQPLKFWRHVRLIRLFIASMVLAIPYSLIFAAGLHSVYFFGLLQAGFTYFGMIGIAGPLIFLGGFALASLVSQLLSIWALGWVSKPAQALRNNSPTAWFQHILIGLGLWSSALIALWIGAYVTLLLPHEALDVLFVLVPAGILGASALIIPLWSSAFLAPYRST